MSSRACVTSCTNVASATLEHSIRSPRACSSFFSAKPRDLLSFSPASTRSMKQSCVWDTQPTRATAPEIRFLDQRQINQNQETGLRKRSKQHLKVFAVISIKCRQCIRQKKLRDESSTNLRVVVRTSSVNPYTYASTSSPPSDLTANSSKTISMVPSTSTRGSRVLRARTSEPSQKISVNICTLALIWRS